MSNLFKRLWLAFYRLGLRFGVHIIPVHYYSPIPNIRELEKTKESWAKKSKLMGVSAELTQQIPQLSQICLPYQGEYKGNAVYNQAVQQGFGQGYGYIEAQALRGVIRHFKPQRVIEVGSGISTFCILNALQTNKKQDQIPFHLICIDPYPSLQLQQLSELQLINKSVQTLEFDFFSSLQENDLLFIDSSHTVKTGGDVNFLILEVLPRLQKGVIIHFHDIFLPYDYPRNSLQTFFPWMETALLHAFLINNDHIKILFSLSQLHYENPEYLKEIFPDYNPQSDDNGLRDNYYKPFENPSKSHFPSSIYLKTS
ncbi:MAG: class I SAM-dependent methyltransferase [Microcystaceae cyanobacterium]